MLTTSDGWLRVAIALAAFAGLRQGEVRALEVRDVDLEAGIITVRRALSENEPVAPKSGHERVIPIGTQLAQVLTRALRGKLPGARVVLNQSGRTPSRQGFGPSCMRSSVGTGFRSVATTRCATTSCRRWFGSART
jgi:integrase